MKHSFIFCLIFFISSCGFNTTENGVSSDLARGRKKSISNLEYDLEFSIPSCRDSSVSGRVEINFKNASRRLPQIDYRASKDMICEVFVNGEECSWDYINEHIVFKQSLLDSYKGDVSIDLAFVSPDQSLNRREDLLYTLLVPDRARTLFPCFDQPDLKGKYKLSLELPKKWIAVSNTSVEREEFVGEDRHKIVFGQSDPLSTYLFSFVVGDFKREIASKDGRSISIYHRENDPKRLSQLPEIFGEIFESLDWLEDYTAMKYPFQKYDCIILPGFQYGGMEHTGATLYNDNRMFLSQGAGLNEQIGRFQLVAHETAHMWFGDCVTMRWFDEVWTKEVFANYFAALMTADKFEDVDMGMNFIDYAVRAYAEDRSLGANPVKQELDNLNNAGLVYGNIIYNKSPIVMENLAVKLGSELFREGIQEYLAKYKYANASWGELIEIFDAKSEEDLGQWSRVWIQEKGMPSVECHLSDDGKSFYFTQSDSWGRGIYWDQVITSKVIFEDGSSDIVLTRLSESRGEDISFDKLVSCVLPNMDAKSYGYFETNNSAKISSLLSSDMDMFSEVETASILINLNESYLNGRFDAEEYGEFLLDFLKTQDNPLLFAQANSYLSELNLREAIESYQPLMWSIITDTGALPEVCKRRAFSSLVAAAEDRGLLNELYSVFLNPDGFKPFVLNENEITKLAYELSLRMLDKSDSIIALQRSRIDNPDRLARFDFISRAVVADSKRLDKLFNELLEPENRRIEPWTLSALHYINHPLRRETSIKYLRPALDELQRVQRTGDIFFPRQWVKAITYSYPNDTILPIVNQFFADNPHYPSMLKLKVLQSLER